MQFDFRALGPRERYKLMIGFIVPRPIALVTTRSKAGLDNAAPFSFFNMFGEEPPLVVLGLDSRPDGTLKDTTANINESGEFVVNLVDESIAEQMMLCAIEFPPGESEIDPAGFSLAACTEVQAGRIAEAPVSFECRKYKLLEFGNAGRVLMIGEIIHLHARDGLVDPETLRINRDAYHPIGRLAGAQYLRTTDRFDMPLMTYEEWCAKKAEGDG